jgi:hypothetical protein
MFERLLDEGSIVNTMLLTQRRMHPSSSTTACSSTTLLNDLLCPASPGQPTIAECALSTRNVTAKRSTLGS